ncbi:glycerate kinase type-2 family protein [Kiloniella sp. b19]|uniref:glycerate kinase type-2 family protein n=1 Tax=Kiloniella sp. GXU_MW_B19 TaxID=3141326 RepID=UPI0031CFBA56
MASPEPKTLLRSLFQAGLDAANPRLTLPGFLPEPGKGRTIVIGAGKAGASMAKAVEENWSGELDGLVVTRYDHDLPEGEKCRKIEVVEASHPVPDAAGREAAERILQKVQGLNEDDLVLCLISGGGSALLSLPAEGVSLEDKQAVNKMLLKSGANIGEMNTVRKHLSAIKGGQLAAAAAPARVVSLLISDVPGDDPDVIASGPTVADPTTFDDAKAVIAKYGIELPASVQAHFDKASPETPKPGDARLAGNEVHMISAPQASLEAAAKLAQENGVTPLILGDSIEGESREVAKVMAAMARQVATHGQPAPAPCVLLSGGETTVTVRGKGRGGRNAEFLLALAIELDGAADIHAIAGDTDGIDGIEDNAGAMVFPDSLARAAAKGTDAKAHLANNDAYSFFESIDDLVFTGPTLTNVNDFRAILVLPKA